MPTTYVWRATLQLPSVDQEAEGTLAMQSASVATERETPVSAEVAGTRASTTG